MVLKVNIFVGSYHKSTIKYSLQANQLFLKRSGSLGGGAAAGGSSADKCDGQDELGCYQVSLIFTEFGVFIHYSIVSN